MQRTGIAPPHKLLSRPIISVISIFLLAILFAVIGIQLSINDGLFSTNNNPNPNEYAQLPLHYYSNQSILYRKNNDNKTRPITENGLYNNIIIQKISSKTLINNETGGFSFCLLLKDDNDILNEWLAYHYHVVKLRYLIVAIDPSSKTSPSSIFDTWRSSFNDFIIKEWTDEMYLPDYFVQDHAYHLVPSFLPIKNISIANTSIWHEGTNSNPQQVQQDLLNINNHRFRQATFVTQCIHELRKQNRTWMAHIDTDEYIVVNPRLRHRPNAVAPRNVTVPSYPFASSIYNLLLQMFEHYPKRLSRSCQFVPSVLYGSVIDDDSKQYLSTPYSSSFSSSSQFDKNKFETLRWKHHAAYTDQINGLQKTILDVSSLSNEDDILQNPHVRNIHRFSATLCRAGSLVPDKLDEVRRFPLTINHYVGSYRRYSKRGDVRRNDLLYKKKASVDGGKDDNWIDDWLPDFVESFGIDVASKVLKDYMI